MTQSEKDYRLAMYKIMYLSMELAHEPTAKEIIKELEERVRLKNLLKTL